MEYCKARRKELIVGCDANAHSEVWGRTDNNNRGESLLEFLVADGLTIHNIGTQPTFDTRVREEVLDITFSTSKAAPMIRDWRVLDENLLSDHRMITFNIVKLTKLEHTSRNPSRTNWDDFKHKLKVALQDSGAKRITCTDELDREVGELNRAIIGAFEDSCPLRRQRSQNDATWWSQGLERGRKTLRKLFNAAKRTGEWSEYDWRGQ